MNDKMTINLMICGNNYPLNVDPKDEGIVRTAAKQVDTWYNKYRAKYENVSPMQAMTMAAFQFAVDALKAGDRNDAGPYANKIEELSKFLEDYIGKAE